MKSLILLRHAKTEADAIDDSQRQLTERGQQQAASMAAHLDALGLPRLYVLVSTATRAQQTWSQIADTLSTPVEVYDDQRIYTFDEDELLQIVREVPEDEDAVLVVGHNPGISHLVTSLSASALPDDRAVSKYGALRTCRGAVLDYDGLWGDLIDGDATVGQYLSPDVD